MKRLAVMALAAALSVGNMVGNSILCETAATSPEAEPTYSIVTVYEDLEGNAEITETFDFTANE